MDTLPYLEFRLAQTRHQLSASQLPVDQRASLRAEAVRQWQLEELILSTPLAQTIPVDFARVAEALSTIRSRYPDQAAYLADLAANDLDEALLVRAQGRELHVEAILAELTRQIPPVTQQDAEAFYQSQHERFFVAEARQARHILITVNEELPENTLGAAQARMDAIAARLAPAPSASQFAEEALRHSECPTALQEGVLGWAQRGQLYPELDAALYEMAPQEIRIAQSPLGLHLLLCEAIRPAGIQPFDAVADKLIASLQSRREKKALTTWLKALPAN